MRWTVLALILAATVTSPAHAGKNRDRAQAAEDAWQACVVSIAARLAGKADANTVADAAFARCENEEQAFRAALREWSRPYGIGDPMPPQELDRQLGNERERIRRQALVGILGG